MTTIFSKIIQGKIEAKKIYKDDTVLIIEDIHPLAPIHWLVIPQKEIPMFQQIAPSDFSIVEKLIEVIQKVTKMHKIEDYRLVINNGQGAGQTIFHLHIHLLAGRNGSHHAF